MQIKLINPYHDALGRFASKNAASLAVSAAVGVAAITGARGSIAIGREKRANEIIQREAKKGKQITFKSALDKAHNEKISFMGKQTNLKYKHLSAGLKLAEVGLSATAVSLAMATLYKYTQKPSSDSIVGTIKSNVDKIPKAGSNWPSGARLKDFDMMHKRVQFVFHPENIGSYADSNRISNAYKNKDWDIIKSYYNLAQKTNLENALFLEDAVAKDSDLFYLFKKLLNDDVEFLQIKSDEEIPPFIYKNGYIVIDRPTIEYIVNLFE